MITTGIFPDAFKVSKVTPIFKKVIALKVALEDFDSHNTETDINAELEKVNTWLLKLSLNAQKTKFMLFHRKQKHVNDANVKIDNTIEVCQSLSIIPVSMNRLLCENSECKFLSTCRRNQMFVKSFRNIPSQVSTYLIMLHLTPPPPRNIYLTIKKYP